jgi:hypothetical protein
VIELANRGWVFGCEFDLARTVHPQWRPSPIGFRLRNVRVSVGPRRTWSCKISAPTCKRSKQTVPVKYPTTTCRTINQNCCRSCEHDTPGAVLIRASRPKPVDYVGLHQPWR